jgi:hypothetical protein
MYQITEFIDPRVRQTPIATVDSIEAARSYLAERFTIICFEADADHDAADAMVLKGVMQLKQFTVERSHAA